MELDILQNAAKARGTPVRGKHTVTLVEEEEFAFVVSGKTQPELALNIGGVPNIKFIIDSGASCNVIYRELWETLKASKVKCESRELHSMHPTWKTNPQCRVHCYRREWSSSSRPRYSNAARYSKNQ